MIRFKIYTLFLVLLYGEVTAQQTTPWHNTERAFHYQPLGNDFVTVNGKRKFNRAIYGTNTGFRVEAGDLPEFALYMPGMGGNLKPGIISNGKSKWLADAATVKAIYRPGSMIYEVKDPMLGNGTVNVTVLALANAEGMIIKIEAVGLPEKTELAWLYGGASGKKFSRDGDIGADPESSFYLQNDYCKDNIYAVSQNAFSLLYGFQKPLTEEQRYEIQQKPEAPLPAVKDKAKELQSVFPGKVQLADASAQATPLQVLSSAPQNFPVVTGKVPFAGSQVVYLLVQKPEGTVASKDQKQIAALFTGAEVARKKLAERIVLHTPDPFINPLAGALSVAADAIWEDPSYLHGAVAWRMRLPAWRGPYVADVLGWHDRARTHFSSYALSQVVEPAIGPVVADTSLHRARQLEKIGTSMFSSGYICRNPNGDIRPHHYDMNLVYIDQLLNHFNWTGDTAYVRTMWPVLQRHLAWEKRNYDADGDGLYDAYCCIWASDALQYSGGGVTHSSAYNYRSNKMAAALASMLGEDGSKYQQEADHILKAMQQKLWLADKGWYAEYRDLLGNQLPHDAPGLWTVYHAIDGGTANPFQSYQMIQYVRNEIPHIPFTPTGSKDSLFLLSTTNWQPYTWSVNNVALAEELHTALASWQGGNHQYAYNLWRSALIESMYMSASPGGFEQLSFYDAVRGELYRDFGDPIGMAARSLAEGLFGIQPDAMNNRLVIRPGFPEHWQYAQLALPDVSIDFKKSANTLSYKIQQSFPKMLKLQLQLNVPFDKIAGVMVNGKTASWKWNTDAIGLPAIIIEAGAAKAYNVTVNGSGNAMTRLNIRKDITYADTLSIKPSGISIIDVYDPQQVLTVHTLKGGAVVGKLKPTAGNKTIFLKVKQQEASWWQPLNLQVKAPVTLMKAMLSQQSPAVLIKNNSNSNLTGTIHWVNMAGISIAHAISLKPSDETKIAIPDGFVNAGANRISITWNDGTAWQQEITDWNVAQPTQVKYDTISLTAWYNDKITQIFQNKYLSPRPAVTTLQLPWQGIGNWCYPLADASIDDSGLRKLSSTGNGVITMPQGIPFATPANGTAKNILYTSLWDNYPEKANIPLDGKAGHIYLLMAGSTNHMQSRFTNGTVKIYYKDGSQDSLQLKNPENWWPVEQDYLDDGFAFTTGAPRPYRLLLKSGRFVNGEINYQAIKGVTNRAIDGGAATVLDMCLNSKKELSRLELQTVANDVVIGLMSVTLVR